MMKPSVLLLAVLGCAAATPNGYYHQEYNYKTSASSYKNNELQHQTDDQGYYKKDGDLAGRVKPRIDSNSEHSEYVNPNLRVGEFNTGLVGGANGDMSSYGHMRADVGTYGARDVSSEGLAHADRIVGSRGGAYQGYSSGSYGSNSYGSSSQSYGMSSNLRSVTSNIKQDLERELQQAVQDNRAYSQSGTSFSDLERELRQNLTNRLNAELTHRYGQQSVRGGLSYTISDGRLHSTANYDNQELQDLRRQLENTLLNQLRSQYSQSSSSRYVSHQQSQDRYGYSSTARPVYYTQYPIGYGSVTTARPVYTADYTRYTPISNPQTITNIASRVQNRLDTRLNQILEDVQRRHFSSSSSYSLTNTDVILENLRNELRNNITYLLNEDVTANYGNQILRDGYMYSVGPNGQTSTQNNYAVHDLENLKSQIERNLIEKLNRDFETYRSRWNQQSAYNSQSSYSGNVQSSGYNNQRYGTYSTPRYDTYSTYSTPRYDTYSTYTTPRYIYSTPQYRTYDSDVENLSTRPAASHITPLITSGGGGSSSSSSSDRHYSLLAGSRQAGYEISGSSGSNIGQLQRQLQSDLSRQLQAAISRGQYGSYSSSSSYSPQSYQSSLQQLTDELNRNLTRQLQEYSASGYYSSYGNFDQSQLASLRSQLQADLLRQLQQGLQQSYQSSSSYSASSSSSSSASNGNYRPARGFDNHQQGQYRSGGGVYTMDGADCAGDDPNAYSNSHRMKRSYQPYRSQHIGLSYAGNNYRPSYNPNQQQLGQQQVEEEPELGQVIDESDLTQQVQDASFEKLQQGQQEDDSDSTQQVEDSGIGKLQLVPENQQVEQNQQLEYSPSGKLQLTSPGQQVDDSDLTQQVQDSEFGRLQLNGQSQIDQSQLPESSDLTQQVEDTGFGRLELGGQSQQQIDQNQLEESQQVDNSQGRYQTNPGQQSGGQITQEVEEPGLSRLQQPSRGDIQLGTSGQNVDNSDLTQQVEDPDLTQQVEDNRLGKLELTSQNQQQTDDSQNPIQFGQQEDNSDLTQQQTDGDLSGGIQLGSSINSQNQNQYTQSGNLQGEGIGGVQSESRLWPASYGNRRLKYIVLGTQYHSSQKIRVSQIEKELLQQIEDAVKKYYISHSGPVDSQLIYQNTLREVERNLKQQLESISLDSSTSTRYNPLLLSRPQIESIQQELLDEFKIKLEQEISDATTRYPSTQQTDDNSLLFQQQQNGFSDQQNQPVAQIPQSPNSYVSSNLQFGNRPSDYNRLTSNLDRRQEQTVHQIESELSKQLQDAVKNYYVSYSGSVDFQSTYQDILRELQRNLTQQLQALGPNGGNTRYSYTVVFSGPQVQLLQEQLENELKVQLQREISNTAATNYNPQQTDQTSGLYSQNHLTPDNQETSAIQNIVQQPSNTDQQTQVEEIDAQLPENPIEDNQPGSRPFESSNLQFATKPPAGFVGFNFNERQRETAHRILTELSRQLSNDVRNYISYSGSVDYQTIYQEKLRELLRNISRKLQTVSGSSGYSHEVIFNHRQLELLKSQLENQLSFQLQNDISTTAGINFKPQEINQYPQNNLTPENQESQPTQTIVEQSINTDDQNQEVENANERESNVNPNRPSYKPYVSGNLPETGNRPTYEYFGSNFNERQKQTVQQIETELSNQVRGAVKNYYISYSGSADYQSLLQNILQELQRNLTSQLQSVGPNSGNSYTVIFSGPQVQILQKQLESQLQLQLQQEISNAASQTQQSVQQPINTDQQNQQVEDIDVPSSSQPIQPVGRLYPSGHLQLGNRPINQRPTNSFLQTEIAQQQNQYPYWYDSNQQNNLNQRPNNLPSLNQIIQQQQSTTEGDVSPQEQTVDVDNSGQYPVAPSQNQWTNQNTNGQIPEQSISLPEGQTRINQGQLVSQSQYGQTNQDFYLNQNNLAQPEQQTDVGQVSSQTYLTQGQRRLADQLENDLSKQLQDAISQNRFTITYTSSGTINPETYQLSYEQLLRELQQNITKQIEQQLNSAGQSSYTYGYSFTQEQKEKLAKDFAVDLSSQLQQLLETQYIHYNRRPVSSGVDTYPAQETGETSNTQSVNAHHGLTATTNQLNYGQQEQVPEPESVAPIQPVEPVIPSVVQNVEPQVSQNLGVKGRRRPRPVTAYAPVPQSQSVVPPASVPTHDEEVFQPDAELITPLAPSSGTQEITAQDETQENLPWYKRFHNKVRQGVTNLKEKIIG